MEAVWFPSGVSRTRSRLGEEICCLKSSRFGICSTITEEKPDFKGRRGEEEPLTEARRHRGRRKKKREKRKKKKGGRGKNGDEKGD